MFNFVESSVLPFSTSTDRKWARLPLKFVIVVLMCAFTAIPALALWWFSWEAGDKAFHSMLNLGRNSVENVVLDVRELLISNAQEKFMRLIEPSEIAYTSTVSFVKSLGIGQWQTPDAVLNFSKITEMIYPHFFHNCRATKQLSQCGMSVLWDPRVSLTTGKFISSQQWGAIIRMNYSITDDKNVETIYWTEQFLNSAKNASVDHYFFIDQNTGVKGFEFYTNEYDRIVPMVQNYFTDLTPPEQGYWSLVLDFDPYGGAPQILLGYHIPFPDFLGCFRFGVATDVYFMSKFLKSLLSGPKERMFANFRTYFGELIGTSHGKFFSHSDIDYSARNPLIEPPPVKQFKRFKPTDSTDATIKAAADWLMANNADWTVIPELRSVIRLNGEDFWFASARISTPLGFEANLVLLVDKESRMSLIEQEESRTLKNIDDTNKRLTGVIVAVVVGGCGLAFFIALLLTRSLGRLAYGMNSLSMLRFQQHRHDSQDLSRFREVANCEHSFVSLERGLRAFVKYVPFEVVRLMLTGEMVSEQFMVRRIVTILFQDIVGFSSLCERLSPERLVHIAQAYLQAMCALLVGHEGTLDKFIGDCIMAIFNAPRLVSDHASRAIAAALDMQNRLMRLNEELLLENTPEQLRFRVGIHTSNVLVGNYGCDYRINYTCLGDGVNLASRLEGACKKFSTVMLVSESTFMSTLGLASPLSPRSTHENVGRPTDNEHRGHPQSHHFLTAAEVGPTQLNRLRAEALFFFRKVALITVAGKAEVVSIYEPMFWQQQQPEQFTQPRPLPGSATTSPQGSPKKPESPPPRPLEPVASSHPLMVQAPSFSMDDVPVPMSGLGSKSPSVSLSATASASASAPASSAASPQHVPAVIATASSSSASGSVSATAFAHKHAMRRLSASPIETTPALGVCEGLYTPESGEEMPSKGKSSSSADFVTTRRNSSSAWDTRDHILYRWKMVSPEFLSRMARHYERGLGHYINGEFTPAIAAFNQAQTIMPEDGPTSVLIDQCRTTPLMDVLRTWDGVIRFGQK